MSRLKPSDEQKEIIESVTNGFNVLVDAVAGSGKTTTVLFLASAVPDKRIVLFTYNARLKAETRERVRKLGITNVEVHSYHSFGVAHYVNSCITDTDLKNIMKYNYPLKNNPNPHIVIMDETQDMTPLYFQFVRKALVDMNNISSQLVILGDNLQCIYDFPQKGADLRFLTMADKLYTSSYPWKKLSLRTSYRITKPMEHFINDMVLGYPRMKSVKDSAAPVEYITGDIFQKMPEYVYRTVLQLLEVYKPDDIFILAPSVRTHNEDNPIKKLENILVKRGIPCYVPISDDSELKDEVLANKVVFSSFHQSKGLERKVVFVYNFNSAYFTYYAKDKDISVCPNTMYVAITRALERLYVCAEDNKSTPFAFINMQRAGAFVKRVVLDKPMVGVNKDGKDGKDDKNIEIIPMRRVTDLTRFIPDELLQQMVELCKMEVVRGSYKNVSIPDSIQTAEGLVETVYELNGIAIPTIYEHRLTNRISIREDLQNNYSKNMMYNTSLELKFMKDKIQSVLNVPSTAADYLKLANVYSAYISGYIHKIAQIKEYNWFSHETVEELYGILANTIGHQNESSDFEYTLQDDYDFHGKKVRVCGRADLVDSSTVWELKCVSALKDEHFVQLALYAWLWQNTHYNVKGRRRFLIHNIRTGEVLELKGIENLNYIADMVLDNHFRTTILLTDEEFLAKCKNKYEIYSQPNISTLKCMIVDD
jgi:hypothetical protein